MSNRWPAESVEVCDGQPSAAAVEEVAPILADLGAITVRRLLPRKARRLVGPWCFLDVFGPVKQAGLKPMDVPPHPHIGLQTVTWLFAGDALHRDSLGSEARAVPGSLNLMTAGRGIAHSEETPSDAAGAVHGVQLWIALPGAHRDTAPAFNHYAERPHVDVPGGRVTVILGRMWEVSPPGRTFSPLIGAEIAADRAPRVVVPLDPSFEHAVVPIDSGLALEERALASDTLYYLGTGRDEICLTVEPGRRPRALLLGGAPLGESVLMWWNFVARTADEIVSAREDWQAGRRFGEVRGYPGERLEAPAYVARPVPANPLS
ncbi:MAG TPA: pirin family protein [Vicinamibacteria bacterium]|nr:pirin family protein [Vicinamibacteria bacterium]